MAPILSSAHTPYTLAEEITQREYGVGILKDRKAAPFSMA